MQIHKNLGHAPPESMYSALDCTLEMGYWTSIQAVLKVKTERVYKCPKRDTSTYWQITENWIPTLWFRTIKPEVPWNVLPGLQYVPGNDFTSFGSMFILIKQHKLSHRNFRFSYRRLSKQRRCKVRKKRARCQLHIPYQERLSTSVPEMFFIQKRYNSIA